jgi:hypothetical protein
MVTAGGVKFQLTTLGDDRCLASPGAAYVAYHRGAEINMEEAKKGEFRSLVTTDNGGQILLVRFDGKQWLPPMPVTEQRLDLWKPTAAIRTNLVAFSRTKTGANCDGDEANGGGVRRRLLLGLARET